MPGKLRLYISSQSQHIVMRGHNHEPILARDDNFRFLYWYLREASEKYSLAVHVWVFMHNHLHLLVTPNDVYSLP